MPIWRSAEETIAVGESNVKSLTARIDDSRSIGATKATSRCGGH